MAPVPGETKIWQYITLFKRISLIDCPGVVVDTAGDTEEDSVLKGVVRAERLENPEDFVESIVNKVKREHITAQYKLKDGNWKNCTELMEMIARQCGRLRKGGDPCMRSAAIMLINDFQRGRLPHYVAPPELKEEEPRQTDDNIQIEQNLDSVGVEHMQAETKCTETSAEVAVTDAQKPEAVSHKGDSLALIEDGDWDDQ